LAVVLSAGAFGASSLLGATSAAADTATHFSISVPSDSTAGDSFAITVSALDSSNAVDATYSGTVEFSSSDGNATLPSNSTLSSGTGAFTVTLKTAGDQTITATDESDESITGTSNAVGVTAAEATQLIVSAPSAATQGTAFNFSVTAEDDYGNVDESYDGTVTFTSTDSAATLPDDSTLSDGSSTFSAILNTTGDYTITATDTDDSDINGTSDTITVSAEASTTTTTTTAATPVAASPTFTG
jgi:hypothetical protein